MALTALAFLMLFFGGLLLAFAIHPRFGLYTYLAVFYVHPPSRWWGDMLPDIRWSLVAAVVALLALIFTFLTVAFHSLKTAHTNPVDSLKYE